MLFSSIGSVAILFLAGVGAAFAEPEATGVNSNSIQSTPTQTTKPVLHALGGPVVSAPTATASPVEWSSVIKSHFVTPIPLNTTANITFSNPTYTHLNGSLLDISQFQRNQLLNSRSLPVAVDWRNYLGLNWLTTIQDQQQCGSCWAFAATALMETMAAGKGAGIADEACDPYETTWMNGNYMPCADRSGRALRVPQYVSLSTVQDQKKWITEVGPITATFNVFYDFDYWTIDKGPYKYDGKSDYRGSHVVLVIGYDDNKACWIIRNSWGTSWGDSGYGLIAYGQVDIDNFPKEGMSNVNPDAWTRKRHHNGNMYQSGNGATHRNFELVRSGSPAGFTHIYRSGEAPFTWGVGTRNVALEEGTVIPGQEAIGQPVITGTSFNGDFEVLYLAVGGYLQHWYFSQTTGKWYYTGQYGWGEMAGYPGFVQTTDSNFAIVVRTKDSTLIEFQRSAVTGQLTTKSTIASNILQSGPALVQSNIGPQYIDPLKIQGNLYVVAVLTSGQMQMFWRSSEPGTNMQWIASEKFGSKIPDTPPVMVQDYWRTADENTPGGFQLCIAVNGQVQHWQRVNENIGTNPPAIGTEGEWNMAYQFGTDIKHVWSLIHGSLSQSLELVVEDIHGKLWHWEYTGTWAPTAVVPGP